MAAMAQSYADFEATLEDAQAIYKVDFASLNNSGVTGTALVTLSPEDDGSQFVNVSIAVEGMESSVAVPQHIHGLFDDDGNPADSQTPDISADEDGDGFVEVIEGVPNYGDVLLTLVDEEGEAPTTNEDGSFSYNYAFDVNDDSNFGSPVTMTDYEGDDILPLMLREIVLHGVTVPEGAGEGTDGEVDGTGGFKGILPAAAGEIEQIDRAEAMNIAMAQQDVIGVTATADADGGALVGTEGSDDLTGGAGSDAIVGLEGMDTISGGETTPMPKTRQTTVRPARSAWPTTTTAMPAVTVTTRSWAASATT